MNLINFITLFVVLIVSCICVNADRQDGNRIDELKGQDETINKDLNNNNQQAAFRGRFSKIECENYCNECVDGNLKPSEKACQNCYECAPVVMGLN